MRKKVYERLATVIQIRVHQNSLSRKKHMTKLLGAFRGFSEVPGGKLGCMRPTRKTFELTVDLAIILVDQAFGVRSLIWHEAIWFGQKCWLRHGQ